MELVAQIKSCLVILSSHEKVGPERFRDIYLHVVNLSSHFIINSSGGMVQDWLPVSKL